MLQPAAANYCAFASALYGRLTHRQTGMPPLSMPCAGHTLRMSALVIAGLNAVGFIATAATKSHKLTDLTVSIQRVHIMRMIGLLLHNASSSALRRMTGQSMFLPESVQPALHFCL